ncbi:MAG: alpha-L-fucosidase, partial [bacterium]
DVLWWDTPVWMNAERAARLLPLIRLRPGIITNNRLGGGFKGDTDTPEQRIPATGIEGRDWETCMTMNDTWGYKSYDDDWKSTETLIRNLVDITSKGGNYLLNVGPTPEGLIPEPSIRRLEEVGAWMKVNGEAIYGTTASPFARLTWGRCTKKLHKKGATLFLHVFDWPADGRILVPGLKSAGAGARLLATGAVLDADAGEDGVTIALPAEAPDPIASVVVLEIEGELRVEKVLPRPGADGVIRLTAPLADLHQPGYGTHIQVEDRYGEPSIGYWTDARAWVAWSFTVIEAGTYEAVGVVATAAESSRFITACAGQKQDVTVTSTGGYADFREFPLGRFRLDTAGMHELSIVPDKENWQAVNLRAVRLNRVQ